MTGRGAYSLFVLGLEGRGSDDSRLHGHEALEEFRKIGVSPGVEAELSDGGFNTVGAFILDATGLLSEPAEAEPDEFRPAPAQEKLAPLFCRFDGSKRGVGTNYFSKKFV